MELHGISSADLTRAQFDEAELKSAVSVSRIKDWELRLLNTVARAFGCRLMWRRSNSYAVDVYGRYVILGLKTQVELAHYTAAVMQRRLVKARSQFVSSHRFYDRAETTRQADSFCHGWVKAVGETVHDFAMTDDLRKELDEEYGNRCKGKPAKMRETKLSIGYHAGVAAGKGESIHRPLNERSPTLQIGG
ncbi:hypothetical protein [Caudoviricetes sp.]|nr:hypothetical protein [Caudoviricetes sp.]